MSALKPQKEVSWKWQLHDAFACFYALKTHALTNFRVMFHRRQKVMVLRQWEWIKDNKSGNVWVSYPFSFDWQYRCSDWCSLFFLPPSPSDTKPSDWLLHHSDACFGWCNVQQSSVIVAAGPSIQKAALMMPASANLSANTDKGLIIVIPPAVVAHFISWLAGTCWITL